jgi:hypothetical protein
MAVPFQKRLQRYVKESLDTLFSTTEFKRSAKKGITQAITVACSDETTDLATGNRLATFRMPYKMKLTEVRASVTTAPEGSIIIVDIQVNRSQIFSGGLLEIQQFETTSVGQPKPPQLSVNILDDNAEVTIDLIGVGSVVPGKGLKVTFIGQEY